MSESELARNGSESGPDGQRMGRRDFVRNMTVFSAAVLAGPSLLEGYSPPAAEQLTAPTAALPTPGTAPAAASPATLTEAVRNRKSTNAFNSQPLPKETLLDLLWMAWGINRPASGKRTAPSAMNAQEIDLYVLLPDGTHVYDATQNELTQVSDQDLRAKTGGKKFQDVPVHLIFVADYAKFRVGTQSEKELWSAAHTGFIGQNVYLYCAAEGLGAHFYAGMDRVALKESLQLRADQAVVFGQVVGYPNE
jgi:hypothetical protein